MRGSRAPLLGLAAAELAALSLGPVGCGGSDDSADENPAAAATTTSAPATTAGTSTTAPQGAGASATTVQVDADPGGALAWTPETLSAPAGPVPFAMTNTSPVPHNIAVDGDGVDSPASETIQGGGTTELTVE